MKFKIVDSDSDRPSRSQLLQQAIGSSSASETRRLLNTVKMGSKSSAKLIDVDPDDPIQKEWIGKTLTVYPDNAPPWSKKVDDEMIGRAVRDVVKEAFGF